MYDLCPGFSECKTSLAPGLYYKHDPSMCKRCHDRWRADAEPMACKKCKQVLAATAFYANAKKCKECIKQYQKEYREFRSGAQASGRFKLRMTSP